MLYKHVESHFLEMVFQGKYFQIMIYNIARCGFVNSQHCQLKHITISPCYTRSNGFAETTELLVEIMIRKCYLSSEDIYKGISILHNAPKKFLVKKFKREFNPTMIKTLVSL